jgi:hypothetical protein
MVFARHGAPDYAAFYLRTTTTKRSTTTMPTGGL